MTDGRRKGNTGELEVARIVEKWWRTMEPNAEFARVPLSGGWHKGSAVTVDKQACGDLMTNSHSFPFCIEVKRREQWSVDNLLDGKKTPPWGWWCQCLEAAQKQSAVPMMWLRKNRLRGSRQSFPWLVWIPDQYRIDKQLNQGDVQWSDGQLEDAGIKYGGVLPVAYVYTNFLKMAPRRFRLPKGK